MEKFFSKLEGLSDHIRDYADSKIRMVKVKSAEKISFILSGIMARVILAVFFFIFILLGSISGAYALAQWTGELYWGFLIVAVFYLLSGIFIWSNKEKLLRTPIFNKLIKELFKENKED